MRHRLGSLLVLLALASCTNVGPPGDVTLGSQGWSESDRQAFYTVGQGSQLMPYRWFRALRRLDVDAAFAADQLQRYGYLPNPPSVANPENLPVGFTIDGNPATGHIGMTCAACHTTQITYRGQSLRIDGARASADFQSFLSDLTQAAQATHDQPNRFDAFAREILGPTPTPLQVKDLRTKFATWTDRFGKFIAESLPDAPWGPGRLDAVGMIFNRVSALDLGRPENYRKADAPVRYPFLWDAPRQDKTQWLGFAPNGRYIFGLTRNTGQVLGVFASFDPHKGGAFGRLRYDSSANLDNLQALEELVTKLNPPVWPTQLFGRNQTLADQGKRIFEAECSSCHQKTYASPLPAGCQRGNPRVNDAWATPLCNVGTDPRAAFNAGRRAVNTGIMRGTTPLRIFIKPLAKDALYTEVLAHAVIGVILQQAVKDPLGFDRGVRRAIGQDIIDRSEFAPTAMSLAAGEALRQQTLNGRLGEYATAAQRPVGGAAYEGRVLTGIWAVAPYLHNGSVPNLWELLQPAAQRSRSFMVGSLEFDPVNVGFATDSSPFNATFTVNETNGNSNAGHEYGTALSPDDKRALIEYLKGL